MDIQAPGLKEDAKARGASQGVDGMASAAMGLDVVTQALHEDRGDE